MGKLIANTGVRACVYIYIYIYPSPTLAKTQVLESGELYSCFNCFQVCEWKGDWFHTTNFGICVNLGLENTKSGPPCRRTKLEFIGNPKHCSRRRQLVIVKKAWPTAIDGHFWEHCMTHLQISRIVWQMMIISDSVHRSDNAINVSASFFVDGF